MTRSCASGGIFGRPRPRFLAPVEQRETRGHGSYHLVTANGKLVLGIVVGLVTLVQPVLWSCSPFRFLLDEGDLPPELVLCCQSAPLLRDHFPRPEYMRVLGGLRKLRRSYGPRQPDLTATRTVFNTCFLEERLPWSRQGRQICRKCRMWSQQPSAKLSGLGAVCELLRG